MLAGGSAANRDGVLHHLLVDCRHLVEFGLICRVYGEDHMIVAIADMAENGGGHAAVA
ncbi:hypothetical protein D3C72_2538570 [compost metagenome]